MTRDVAGNVVARGSKSASDKNNFRPRKQFFQRLANRRAVADCSPLVNSQTDRKDLARDEREVGVVNVTREKLGAGIEKDGAHDTPEDSTPNAQRPTPNVPMVLSWSIQR